MKYLALGDSYTIGTAVDHNESFPHQLKMLMSKSHGIKMSVDIIATRGWTTRDLIAHLPSGDDYDFVTLLIGVNDLYDGIPFQDFEQGVVELIQRSIRYVRGFNDKVRVLSIPDYSFTPFAKAKEIDVSLDIDKYNSTLKSRSEEHDVRYIDITDISRKGLDHKELVASDGLHLSEQAYHLIAKRIKTSII